MLLAQGDTRDECYHDTRVYFLDQLTQTKSINLKLITLILCRTTIL